MCCVAVIQYPAPNPTSSRTFKNLAAVVRPYLPLPGQARVAPESPGQSKAHQLFTEMLATCAFCKHFFHSLAYESGSCDTGIRQINQCLPLKIRQKFARKSTVLSTGVKNRDPLMTSGVSCSAVAVPAVAMRCCRLYKVERTSERHNSEGYSFAEVVRKVPSACRP